MSRGENGGRQVIAQCPDASGSYIDRIDLNPLEGAS